MNKINWAMALALLLVTFGMAVMPHATLHEASHHQTELWTAALPYVVGMMIGIVLWLSIERSRFDPAKVHPLFWLAVAVAAMVLPMAWSEDYGRHFYPYLVDPTLVGLPLLAAGLVALDTRMGKATPPMPWLNMVGGVALLYLGVWMAVAFIPFFNVLLFPLLLLLTGNASLRRIGYLGLVLAVLGGAFLLVERPFLLARILNNGLIPTMTMWQDPLGVGYQSVHIWEVLHNLSWFGTNLEIHLPEATRQLLPVVVANRFGGLALAGLLGLIAFWFYLTRPTRQSDTPLDRLGDMVWWALLYFAILNMGGNLLVIGLFGPGMPMFGSNPALLAMALLVVAIRAQHRPAEAKS